MAFDFENGAEVMLELTDRVLSAANDAVEYLMTKSFTSMLDNYPWQYLQKYLLEFCGMVDQNLAKEIVERLEHFFGGAGSFEDFASSTDNSDAAIEAARGIQNRILTDVPSFLSNYQSTYINALEQQLQSRAEARYADGLADELNGAARMFLERLETSLNGLRATIQEAAEENNLVYLMLSVAEIVIGRTEAYGTAFAESIPGFIHDAQELLGKASAAAQSATENAAASAKNGVSFTPPSGI